jgi:hypothetical protein
VLYPTELRGHMKPILANSVFTIGYFFVIIFQEERSKLRLISTQHE